MTNHAVLGRFAPSPSGRMHLGNVFAGMLAWLSARAAGGAILLRIEDLDTMRCTQAFADLLREDLRWLGLDWDFESPPQHTRSEAYTAALRQLETMGLIYPCWCSRGVLHAASAPHASDGHAIYPGLCRELTAAERAAHTAPPSMRLIVPDEEIAFTDGLQGPYRENLAKECGDFVLRKADGVYAYQLAVVVDDADAGVTQVVRGRDLLGSTARQLYLYRLLDRPAPDYWHVPLLTGPGGRRLSKRDLDLDLGVLRRSVTPEQLLGVLAWHAGLLDRPEPASARELTEIFSWDKIRCEDVELDLSLLLPEAVQAGSARA